MTRQKALALALGVVGAVALAVGGSVAQMRAALAQTTANPILIASRERQAAGRREGEVLIGDNVVIRVRSAAGGITAPERAEQIASRLRQLQEANQLNPSSLRVATVNNEYAVMAGDTLVITADTYHAALNRTTPQRLATSWRNNLAAALTEQVAGERTEVERVSSKIVPIVSLGQGIRVGAARITGPATNVSKASLVGQIETTFEDVVRIRIFVPLPSPTEIRRVPQVNVTAYGDIRL